MKTTKSTVAAVSSSSNAAAPSPGSVPVAKTSSLSFSALRRQAWRYLVLAGQYEEALAKAWTPQMTGGLQASLERFDKAVAASIHVRDTRKASRAKLARQVAGALAFRDELAAALKLLAQASPGSVSEAHVRVGRSNRSAVRLAEWFGSVAPAVSTHRAELSKLLGWDPVAKAEELRTVLYEQEARQAGLTRDLREQTGRMREARNQLVSSIDRLHLAAGLVFSREKDVLQKFRKGFVRRPKTAKPPAAAADAPAAPAGVIRAA
jgi:nitroreductase